MVSANRKKPQRNIFKYGYKLTCLGQKEKSVCCLLTPWQSQLLMQLSALLKQRVSSELLPYPVCAGGPEGRALRCITRQGLILSLTCTSKRNEKGLAHILITAPAPFSLVAPTTIHSGTLPLQSQGTAIMPRAPNLFPVPCVCGHLLKLIKTFGSRFMKKTFIF